jgi:hypothetical protein
MMMGMAVITLTSDFGAADWFVGSMKGVILGIEPHATIVDITHEIPAGDIRAGAFALAASYRCFPRNTVHVAVVDPGVGTKRAAIAARTANYFFVGPDNGVLSLALAQENLLDVRRIENDSFFHKPVCDTFHGRDIFAPVAARLTQGIMLDALGPATAEYVQLAWPQPRTEGGVVRGEVIYIDHFGNAITNLILPGPSAKTVRVPSGAECPVAQFYHQVPLGQPIALVASSGFLEIAVNGGNAAQRFGLKIGDPVELH